jgi:hypothetical protein
MGRHKQITAGPSNQVADEARLQVYRFHANPSFWGDPAAVALSFGFYSERLPVAPLALLVLVGPDRVAALLIKAKVPLVREYIARRIAAGAK